MFLMYNEKLPVLYIRIPLSIGPGLCELLRITLMSTSSTELPLETVRKGVLRRWLGKVPSMRKAYQTDLSDAEWSYVATLAINSATHACSERGRKSREPNLH